MVRTVLNRYHCPMDGTAGDGTIYDSVPWNALVRMVFDYYLVHSLVRMASMPLPTAYGLISSLDDVRLTRHIGAGCRDAGTQYPDTGCRASFPLCHFAVAGNT